MNRLKYIVYMLLFTQLLSAGTHITPKITKIVNNMPNSNTATIYFEGNNDKDTKVNIINYDQYISTSETVETNGLPIVKGRISFYIKPDTKYLIQIQTINHVTHSKSHLSDKVPFDSTLSFDLNAGEDRTIILGNAIALEGKLIRGNKDNVDFYRWEENGKILKNTAGDEIIYWNESSAEHGYKPQKEGVHFLKFILTDLDGKEYSSTLRIEVLNATEIPRNQLYLDMENINWNKNLNAYTTTIKLGETLALSGKLTNSKYIQLVDFYHWENNGEILKNTVNDEILYWSEENRENGYQPTKVGEEHLKFVVTDIYGNKIKKDLIVTVKKDIIDDHGDSKDTATKIALNTIVNGEKNYDEDHDFFSFTLDKKQYVEVYVKYPNHSQKATLYTSDLSVIESHINIPASSDYQPINLLLDAGIYYVDVSVDEHYAGLSSSKYTLEIRTEEIVTVDEYGDTKETATEIFDGTTIHSYINQTGDIDYFYFIPKANGEISFEHTGIPVIEIGSDYYWRPIAVRKGEKIY